jgi:hypothetical protein
LLCSEESNRFCNENGSMKQSAQSGRGRSQVVGGPSVLHVEDPHTCRGQWYFRAAISAAQLTEAEQQRHEQRLEGGIERNVQ